MGIVSQLAGIKEGNTDSMIEFFDESFGLRDIPFVLTKAGVFSLGKAQKDGRSYFHCNAAAKAAGA